MDRSISFEHIANARDLGGLRTAEGRVIAPGLLIRSANLAGATEGDRARLREAFRLSLIVDLRTPAEQAEMPDAPVEGAEHLANPVFDSAVAGVSHEEETGRDKLFVLMPEMGQLYRRMVTEPSCRENLGRAAGRVMAHDFSKGAVLWHCTEGKDRCGLLAAVLLLALGAERSTIMEDYMLTNRVNKPKAEQYYQMTLSAGRAEKEAEKVRDVFLAKEEYLNAAFDAMDEQYETTEAFLQDGLHIPRPLMERFRNSVL